MEEVKNLNEDVTYLKKGDTLFFQYKNEYESFGTCNIWSKDNHNMCAYYEGFFKEKAVIGRHWHEALEIIYVMEGSLEMTTANGSLILNDGEMVIIGGALLHGTRCVSGTLHNQCLQIKYEFLVNHLDCDDLALKIFKVGNISKILFYYENVIKYFKSNDYISQMKYKANLLLLLSAIVEDENYNKKNIVSSNFNDTISKIMYYINFNYKENITLNSVAEKFNYTPQNISILFKKRLGKTFHKYLTEIRLENAVHLLLNSDKKVIEISLECGFPNEMAFINKFKIKYNMTPNLYRKQKRKKQDRKI